MQNPRQPTYPIDPQFVERWSPRAFTGETIAEEDLMTILEAARWAPSAFNAQPWRFVWAIRGMPAWQPILDTLSPTNQVWAQRASALIVLVSSKIAQLPGQPAPGHNPWHSFDSGAAWASLALQASLSGLAAHGMAGFESGKLREVIDLPEGYAIEAVAAVGRPGNKAALPEALQQREAPNDRKPLTQLAWQGRFHG
jgi:nitroreductase